MYCPNCGQDCGNDNFCSQCGTKLIRSTYDDINFSNYNSDQYNNEEGNNKVNIAFMIISILFPIVGLLFMLEFRKNIERKKYCAIGTAIGLMIQAILIRFI